MKQNIALRLHIRDVIPSERFRVDFMAALKPYRFESDNDLNYLFLKLQEGVKTTKQNKKTVCNEVNVQRILKMLRNFSAMYM